MKISKEDLLKALHDAPPLAKPSPKIQSNDLKFDAFGNIHMNWEEVSKLQEINSRYTFNSLYMMAQPLTYKSHPIIITDLTS